MIKKHNKARNFTVRIGVTPTKERRRQNGGVIGEIIDREVSGKILIKRYRAVWECPLDAYLDKKAISIPEHQAGLKFRRAYFRAVLCKRAAYERLNQNTGSTEPTKSEKVLKEAYQTLSPHYKGVIINICGLDQPANDMAKLDKLQKGLGQMSDLWKATANEVLE